MCQRIRGGITSVLRERLDTVWYTVLYEGICRYSRDSTALAYSSYVFSTASSVNYTR